MIHYNFHFVPLALIALSILFSSCEQELQINEPGNLVLKTVEQNPLLPSISVNGTQLHVETFGNPSHDLIVFLHGGPGGDYRNALQVEELAQNSYFVILYDQRGSGLSRRHDRESYDIDIMREDLAAVIDFYQHSDSQHVYLFGHSWGAMLAADYVNTYPNEIDGAIFAEAGGFTYDLLEEYAENSRKISLFGEATNDILYQDQFITGKENEHAILDYKLAISTSFSYAEGNDEGIEGPSPFWRYGAAVLGKLSEIAEDDGFDFTENLHRFQHPVLFLYGELNDSYGLEFAEKEAQYFSDARIVEIKNTGHEMVYFQWEQVQTAVLNYLTQIN